MYKKLSFFFFVSAVIFSALSGHAQTVSFDEMKVLIGGNWQGEMKIYDYKKNEPVSYPALLFIQPDGRRTLSLVYRYPEDSENVSKTPLNLKKGGKKIGRYDIVSKTVNKDGELVVKTFGEGKIEWQKVQYFYTYRFSENFFGIKREIWFIEDDIRIIANDFEFRR